MPNLYIVATPIGNLEDITLRALRVLREVPLIAAEDTRVTRKLLSHYDIHTPMTSYHEHNRAAKLPELLAALEKADVALVSDAGTPGVNDPGSELVARAAEAGAGIVPVPGPSALTSAIAICGLAIEQFVYVGFLPRKRVERARLLESVAYDGRAIVALETPHRLKKALQDILETLGDRRIAVCRELTKLHEEVFRGPVSQAIDHFSETRGEFTLVIEGSAEAAKEVQGSEEDAREMLMRLRSEGARAKEAAAQVAEMTGLSKREVYQMWLHTKN
jgi:16S rRNA (cytidine1402-2'-O)-methyltransferase